MEASGCGPVRRGLDVSMTTLITGATGFLGGHVAEACLRRGDSVRALVRATSDLTFLRSLPGVELIVGDLESPDTLAAATRGVDIVIHSAARVTDSGSRKDFWRANVEATQALLAASRDAGAKRFVYVSSPSVVMDDTDQINIDESVPYPRRFLNLYSETKAVAEQSVMAANTPSFITCSLRPRGIWGPRDRTGFLPKFVKKMLASKLPDMSGGAPILASLCYCENAAEACLDAATSDAASAVGGKAYFVTDGEAIDVWAFAREIAKVFELPAITKQVNPSKVRAIAAVVDALWTVPPLRGTSPPISRYSAALLTRSGTYDISAATRDFGYRPRVTHAAGLERLRQWVLESGGVEEFIRHV